MTNDLTRYFRHRPHWHMFLFHYGLGLVVVWQLAEDLSIGQAKIYSGEFFPWRRYVGFSARTYMLLVTAEVALLVLYFLRVRLSWSAALLALVLFLDNLGSFLNHRLLMSLELFLISLCPLSPVTKKDGWHGKHLYWSLDLVRWQLSVVYVFAALHKCNPQFLSGETLHNLFWMTGHHALKSYPTWLLPYLDDLDVCRVLAWLAVGTEFLLPLGLNYQRTARWFLPVAVLFHVLIGVLMAFIWIFSVQMLLALIAFLPWAGSDYGQESERSKAS